MDYFQEEKAVAEMVSADGAGLWEVSEARMSRSGSAGLPSAL